MNTIIQSAVAEPEVLVEVSKELKEQVKTLVDNSLEQQVVVHCSLSFNTDTRMLRIWPSTVLLPKVGGPVAKLVHAINIGLYPQWLYLTADQSPHYFTLIFEGLPKDCEAFDLIESIPEPGGFFCGDIQRNETDVYYIEL